MTNTDASAILAIQLATLGLPTASENAKFTPTAGQLYVTEVVIGDSSLHRAVAGGPRNNRQGIYQVTVMAPKDGTRTPARKAADQIEAAFVAGWRGQRNGTTVAVNEVRVANPIIMGDRYAIPVSVYFTATG